MLRENSDELAPIRKTICVKGNTDEAFRVFTSDINKWWPLTTHSVCLSNAADCALERRLGGRVIEHDREGNEHVWGTIIAWEPPYRIAFTWHPGYDSDKAQKVEVKFTDTGAGMTLVELTHSGWEGLGANAASIHEIYIKGWSFVLGTCYAKGREA